jgi:putative FmdB family regulatory protein
MPIYEFYCSGCNTLFSFYSRTVNTSKRPACPRCRRSKLERQVSAFTPGGRAGKGDEAADLPADESKLESAMSALAAEAEHVNEDDPKQAAQLMRKFSRMSGVEFGSGMEEALGRLEAGEDPEKIESEMGDVLEGEEPLIAAEQGGARGARRGRRRPQPRRDPTLYDL